MLSHNTSVADRQTDDIDAKDAYN